MEFVQVDNRILYRHVAMYLWTLLDCCFCSKIHKEECKGECNTLFCILQGFSSKRETALSLGYLEPDLVSN